MGEAPPQDVVLFTLSAPEPVVIIDNLRKKFPQIKFVYYEIQTPAFEEHPRDIVLEGLYKQATIVATLSVFPEPEVAKHIKFIHLFSAGSDHLVTRPIYTESKVALTTSSGIHGPMISEWIILQILANSHKQRQLLEWQKEHKWPKHGSLGPLTDAVGQRLGVLGYGSIGRQAAVVAKAMGMDVIAFTASPRRDAESKKDTGYIVPGTGDVDGTVPSAWYSGLDKESLHNFLAQDIDILLLSVPLTDKTRHLLDKEEFEILGKKNAFVANISRGAIINHDELLKAARKDPKDGGLRGAALDVTEPEPLNADSELWDAPNITITPHISGISVAYTERSLQVLEKNLTNYLSGRPLINVVDRERGY